MRLKNVFGFGVVILQLSFLARSQAGPFTNGSFEIPVLASSNMVLTTGSTAITGWTVGGIGSAIWTRGPADAASPVDGNQHVLLSSGSCCPGTMLFQEFDTIVGLPYRVSFRVGRSLTATNPLILEARVRSNVVGPIDTTIVRQTFFPPTVAGYGGMVYLRFVATTATSFLFFTELEGGGSPYHLVLDDVQVTEEPTTVCAAISGMVSWWQAEGNANDFVGTNTGTIRSNISYVAGKVDRAFNLDGDSSGVVIGNPASLQLQNFTIEAWVKRKSSSIISLGPYHAGGIFTYSTGGYGFAIQDDGRLVLTKEWISGVTSTLPVADTNWHHVAVTKSGGAVVFYVDGTADAVAAYDPGFTFTSRAAIGDNPDNPGVGFFGLIDEVSIYNRALSSSEVQSIVSAAELGKCVPTVLTISPDGGAFTNSVTITISSSTANGVIRYTFDNSDPSANSTVYAGAILLTNSVTLKAQAFQDSTPISRILSANFSRSSSSPLCAPIPSGLLSWWRGEGGAADQVGANPGTGAGGLLFTSGKVGQAFDFNGIDSQVSFGNTVGNFGANDFTIEFWIRTTSTRHESVLAKWPVCGHASFFTLRLDNGKIAAEMEQDSAGSNGNEHLGNKVVNDGIFHHVALVRQTTNVSLYIDGVLDISNSTPGITSLSNNVELMAGSGPCVGVDGTQFFTGQLDEISIFNRSLSDSEIQAIHNAGSAGKCPPVSESHCAQPPSGMVGWWKGDGGTTDAVGTNNGVFVGNASFAPGVVGQAFSFDGDNDSVMIGKPAALQLQNFSIEAWIKRASTTQVSLDAIFPAGAIFGYGYGGYTFDLSEDGRLALGQVGISAVYSTMSIRDTNWHHVAVTKAAGSVAFYVDGLGEAAPQYDPGFYFISSVQVGASQWDFTRPTASFLGLIDEVSVYNRALAASEIGAIVTAGSAGKCAPLPPSRPALAHWKFDEANGSIAHDSAGTYNGTLSPTGASFVPGGRAGNALSLSKTNNGFVDMGNVLGMESGDFSVIAWVKMTPGDTTQSSAILSKQRAGYANGYLLAANFSGGDPTVGYGADNKAWFYDSDFHGQEVTSTTSVNDGNWHQIVAVYVAGANKFIYVDGAPAEASNASRPLVVNDAKFIVGGVDFAGTPGGLFTGLVDDVQVYDYALSSSDVDFLFQHPGRTTSDAGCLNAPAGLISWWSGDGNANDIQDGNNATPQNGTTFATGKVGQAFSFDGVDDQVLVPHNANQNTGSQITIDAWVNPSSSGHGRTILQKRSASNVGGYVLETLGQPFGPDNGLQFVILIGGTYHTCATTNSVLTLNAWQHVAATYDGSAMRIFVNGVEQASAAVSGAIDAVTDPIVIGRNVVLPADAWQGLIDEVDLFNRALSPSEIQAIYNAGSAGKCRETAPACVNPPSGLAGWWKGDGGTTDAFGTNNGALVGNASFAPGVVGQAFTFDGDNDSVMIGNPAALQLQNFSIEAWIKRASTNQATLDVVQVGHIFGYGYGGYVFALLDDGRLALGQVGLSAVDSTMSIRDTNWHHVAVSKASGTVAFYVDGVGETAPQYNPSFYFTSSAQVGASQWDGTRPTGSFLGLIDEVSVYNRALTASELQTIYQASSSGKCPPVSEPQCVPPPSGLVSQWSADVSATDVSGGNNGNLRGDATYAAGRVGQAFSFDGSGDGVWVGNPANLQLQTFTIEAWLKRKSTTQVSASSIYGEIVGYGFGGYVLGYLSDGRLFLSKNGISDVESTRPIADTNWHHVAVTKLGSSVVFYIDGASETALTYDVTFDFSSSLVIGAVNDTIDSSFLGMIDELSIYNRPLSEDEIRSVYNAGSAGKCVLLPISVSPAAGFYTNSITVSITTPTNLVVFYTLDGTAPSTNSSMYSAPFALTNTATVNAQGFANGVPVTRAVCSAFRFWGESVACVAPAGAISWWTADCNLQDALGANPGSAVGNVTFEPGRIGQAFGFSAEGDAVTVANSPSLQLQNFTIEAWVKRRSSNQATLGPYGGGAIFACGSAGYGFSIFDDGRLGLTKIDASYVASTVVVTDTNWHHVAVTKSGTNVAFYADGAPAGNAIYNVNFSFNSNAAIGATGGNLVASFYGLIDELAIYARPLATNEIQALFSAGAGGKCPTFAPIIITALANRTVPAGANTSFSVVAGGSPTLNYQWSFNETLIPDATNAVLAVANVRSTNAGTYAVTVSNGFAPPATASATLTVSVTPVITQQPKSQTVLIGSTATFTVGYTGTPQPTFQWRRNGLTVTAGTSPILVINNVQTANAGTYTVRITNPLNSVLSAPATLTVASGQFSTLTVTTNGVQLNVQGEANGNNYIIETSSNLIQWDPLATLLNNLQTWQFTDTTASDVGNRFYRLRKSP